MLAAIRDSFPKLDPRLQIRNPVMFIVELGSVITTAIFFIDLVAADDGAWFPGVIAVWLWLTVLFANFAEAIAEGRGKAQARRAARDAHDDDRAQAHADGVLEEVPAPDCSEATSSSSRPARSIPADGEIVEGVGSVDESAITGESAPVIREAGGDRSAVTGGTRLLSDQLVIEVTQEPGKSFLDRMIALVEGAERRKTPNEIALNILLAGLTITFLAAVATLRPFALYAAHRPLQTVLIALLVALIPTTIGALLSAIGIAGMDRLVQRNVLAMSGRAVEASGDVDVLLLDKTGTITLGNRQAAEFIPVDGVDRSGARRGRAARVAGRRDARGPLDRRARQGALRPARARARRSEPTSSPSPPQTRMSGVDLNGNRSARAPPTPSRRSSPSRAAAPRRSSTPSRAGIAEHGGTPLVVAGTTALLGVIHLKDIVKGGMRERFDELRRMGIRTVMITGDNRSPPRSSPRRPASTTSWPRRRPRPRWR